MNDKKKTSGFFRSDAPPDAVPSRLVNGSKKPIVVHRGAFGPTPLTTFCICEHIRGAHAFYETNLSYACTVHGCTCVDFKPAAASSA